MGNANVTGDPKKVEGEAGCRVENQDDE